MREALKSLKEHFLPDVLYTAWTGPSLAPDCVPYMRPCHIIAAPNSCLSYGPAGGPRRDVSRWRESVQCLMQDINQHPDQTELLLFATVACGLSQGPQNCDGCANQNCAVACGVEGGGLAGGERTTLSAA
jgi:hypothetical protein